MLKRQENEHIEISFPTTKWRANFPIKTNRSEKKMKQAVHDPTLTSEKQINDEKKQE